MTVTGNEQMCHLLRALTSAELYLHSEFYSAHPHFVALLAKEESSGLVDTYFSHCLTHEASDLLTRSVKCYSDCVRFEAFQNCQDKRWSPFICIMALSSILGLKIYSHYPETGGRRYAFNLCNAEIHPRQGGFHASTPINLLWSLASGTEKDKNPSFVPNHIVPLFLLDTETTQVKLVSNSSKCSYAATKTLEIKAPSTKYLIGGYKKAKDKQAVIQFDRKIGNLSSFTDKELISKQENQISKSCPANNGYSNCDHNIPLASLGSTDIGSFYSNAKSFSDYRKSLF